MSSLPLLPHIELRGESGVIALGFGLLSTLLFSSSYLLRTNPSIFFRKNQNSKKRPRVSKSQLLNILQDTIPIVKDSEIAAVSTVVKPGTTTASTPIPLAKVLENINKYIQEKSTKELYPQHNITEEDVEEAYRYYAEDPAVRAAAASITYAHPLFLPTSQILSIQTKVVDAEIQIHKDAIKTAEEENIPLNSRPFTNIVSAKVRAAGGIDRHGDGRTPSLLGPELERHGYGEKEPLWSYIVSYMLTQEAAEGKNDLKITFFNILEGQKTALRNLGLSVS